MGEAKRRKAGDPFYGTGWSGRDGSKVERHFLDALSEGPGGMAEMEKIARLRHLKSSFPAKDEEEANLWPDEVFVPSHIMAIATSFQSLRRGGQIPGMSEDDIGHAVVERAFRDNATMSRLAVGMAAWRSGKTIYRFDGDLGQALAETPMDKEMPVEVLRRLPQYGTYVEVKMGMGEEAKKVLPEVIGMLAYYDMVDQPVNMSEETQLTMSLVLLPIIDPRQNDSELLRELAAMFLTKPCAAIPLLKGRSVLECIEIDEYRRGGERDASEESERRKTWLGFYNMLLNMVLYLCSEEPDVEGVREGQDARPRRDLGMMEGAVEAWNVGMRIGSVLRKVKADAERCSEQGEGSYRVKPHIRTGHYHGYWYGPRSAQARSYRMRWVAPTLVNAESEADIVTTVRPVRQ